MIMQDSQGAQHLPEEDHAKEIQGLKEAMDTLANFPARLQWLSPTEKKAFAIKIIGEADIITHARCFGSGRVDSSRNPDGPWCNCPGCNGKIVNDVAKARIRDAYPHYTFEAQE
jgi:hypothetical protein